MAVAQSRGSHRGVIVASLAVGTSLLGYLNWNLWATPVDMSVILSGASADPETTATGPENVAVAAQQTVSDLSQTTSRPLFSATRRPPEPKKVEVAQTAPVASTPQAAPDQLQLLGVIHSSSGLRKALIRTSDDLAGKWIPVGDTVQGWRVKTIFDDKAVIETDGRKYELMLFFADAAIDGKPSQSSR